MDNPGVEPWTFQYVVVHYSTTLPLLLNKAYIITQYAYVETKITRTITLFKISVDMNEEMIIKYYFFALYDIEAKVRAVYTVCVIPLKCDLT